LQVRVLSPLPPPGAMTIRNPSTFQSRKTEPTVLTGMRRYLTESWSELKKVTWPTRETVIRLTLLVIAVSVAVGLYIAVLDRLFNSLLDAVLP
jgi:preprotein translocase subunit SecE